MFRVIVWENCHKKKKRNLKYNIGSLSRQSDQWRKWQVFIAPSTVSKKVRVLFTGCPVCPRGIGQYVLTAECKSRFCIVQSESSLLSLKANHKNTVPNITTIQNCNLQSSEAHLDQPHKIRIRATWQLHFLEHIPRVSANTGKGWVSGTLGCCY